MWNTALDSFEKHVQDRTNGDVPSRSEPKSLKLAEEKMKNSSDKRESLDKIELVIRHH